MAKSYCVVQELNITSSWLKTKMGPNTLNLNVKAKR